MAILLRYKKLPVAIKLLAPPLCIFLGLWTAGTLGFGYFARNNLEQAAQKEATDLATLLQQDLQQKQKLLSLEARWISEEYGVVKAISTNDRALLLRVLLPAQSTLELDLIRIVDPQGQSLISLQQRSLNGVQFQETTLNAITQTKLEISGTLPAEQAAPSSLVSFVPIKSAAKNLATLVVGVAVDDTFLQKIRGNTAMHLVAIQDNRVTAATLPIKANQPWQLPPAAALPSRIEIAGEPYLIKTVELSGFDGKTLKIAVLRSLKNTEQAEQRIWLAVGGFGLFGGGLIVGDMVLGLRVTQALSHRIQSLTQATQALAQGDLSIRIPIDSQDEVGVLAQGFNTMAAEITVRDQQLHQQMQQLQSTLEDLHRTQNQMIQSEKMSALGQMVAGVAHEINNPVNFIHGNLIHVKTYTQDLLQLLNRYQQHYPQPPASLQADLEDLDLDFLSEDLMKILQSMKVGTDRIRDIVISLRNFSRLDESEFKSVNLHEGLDNTLMILQHRLNAGPKAKAIAVVKDYGQLPLVECYPGHLNQVFMNLLANAIDALEDVSQRSAAADPPKQPATVWISTQAIVNDQVQIVIADNGSGMSEEVRSQIFNPFFTTKPVGKGTGLGLSISYQIVTEGHHGQIRCDSTPGEGTKFVIEIPVCQPQVVSR